MDSSAYEVLESTRDKKEAEDALRTLLFEKQSPAEAIAHTLEIAEKYFQPRDLLDNVARNEFPHFYQRHYTDIDFPDILTNWKGDFREDTEDIYAIANGEDHPEREAVENYQSEMRSRLPRHIPLVRGVTSRSPTKHSLTSWTSQVGTASVYGEGYILYTVASPEDVFMCSLHGEKIGEQEFTLTDYSSPDVYEPTTESHVEIYQRMYDVLY